MAKVLVLTGAGDSGRKAAQTVRYDAQRYDTDEHGFRYASREFGLAGRYIDLFGGLVHRALSPARWPRILVLDSKPLNLYPYDAVALGERWDARRRAGAVLAAVGGDDPTRPLRAWGLHLAADETKESWADFLVELPGDVEWVVADGAKAIKQAVMLRWPNAEFVACEFHLGRALDAWAAKDGWPADNSAIKPLLDRAFLSVADWENLITFADEHDCGNIIEWMSANSERARGQIALRVPEFDHHPRSNAAAEGLLNFVDRKLHRRRRFRFRNAPRLQTILNLMRASEAGQAGQAEYAAIIKSLGIALSAAVVATRLPVHLAALGNPPTAADHGVALAGAIHDAFVVAALVCSIGIVTSLVRGSNRGAGTEEVTVDAPEPARA